MSQVNEQAVNRVLQEWGTFVLGRLADKLKERNVSLSGDLLRSLQMEVLPTHPTPSVQIGFEQYGRIREMKATQWTKQPPIEVLEDFVKKVGVDKFQYKGDRVPRNLTESEAIKRIAWGIARSRTDKGIVPKPKRWYNKTFYAQLDDLLDRLITVYQEQAVQAVKTIK